MDPQLLPPEYDFGVRKSIYDYLLVTATANAKEPGGNLVVYFRRSDLAEAARCSTGAVRKTLAWLAQHDYIDYLPGNPGKKSMLTLRAQRGRD